MDLPEVHGSPIIKVSNHLTDPELDPRQVYLKHHAFGLPCCGLSIISDVDCHVWNANEEKKKRAAACCRGSCAVQCLTALTALWQLPHRCCA